MAIIKLSDLSKTYELFIFSELLERSREILMEGKSFLLTVIKDRENRENRYRRINVKNIVRLDDIRKKNYTNVEIEINNADAFFPTFELGTWPIINKSKQIKEENDDYFYRIIEHLRLT